MQHLLRQGHFGIAEKFAESSGVEVDEESKARPSTPRSDLQPARCPATLSRGRKSRPNSSWCFLQRAHHLLRTAPALSLTPNH